MSGDSGKAPHAEQIRALDVRIEHVTRRLAAVEFKLTPTTMAVEECLAFWMGAVLGAIVITVVITLAGRRRRKAREKRHESA